MKLFKRLFGKRSSPEVGRSGQLPDRKIDAFNFTPVPLAFSEDFSRVMEHMEAWADQKLRHVPINELSEDACDPEIDALCRLEETIAYGSSARNVRVVKEIIDACNSQVVRAKKIKESLEEEKKRYRRELDQLEELQQRLRKREEEAA